MPKVACFDFDDVLTAESVARKMVPLFVTSLSHIKLGARLIGDSKDPEKFYATIKKIIGLGKGLSYTEIEGIADSIKPTKNAAMTLRALKKRGYKIVIISSNDMGLVRRFLKKNSLGKFVDEIYAAQFGVKDGFLTGRISGKVLTTAKTGIIRKLTQKYRANVKEITYIGDGMTDLPIIKKLGHGVLFCPTIITSAEVATDKELKEMQAAKKLAVVYKRDLYRIMEFVS